jgi:hypothetical protein
MSNSFPLGDWVPVTSAGLSTVFQSFHLFLVAAATLTAQMGI